MFLARSDSLEHLMLDILTPSPILIRPSPGWQETNQRKLLRAFFRCIAQAIDAAWLLPREVDGLLNLYTGTTGRYLRTMSACAARTAASAASAARAFFRNNPAHRRPAQLPCPCYRRD